MPQECIWQRLPGHRNLKGRAGHTATLVGTRIFVVGGRNGNVFFNDVWVFDTKTENWQQVQKETPLSPRAYHTTTLVRDSELWVIGGSDHNTMYGDVHMLNTDTLEWASPVTRGTDVGRLRGTHAAVVHPLHPLAILVYGGYGGVGSQWLDDLSILHTDRLEWKQVCPKGCRPSARGYHTLTTIGTYVILFGGKGEAGIVPSEKNLSLYDVATDTWSMPKVRGKAPIPRSNHSAALLGENLIVIQGGRNGTERLSDTFALQISVSSPGGAGSNLFSWHTILQGPSTPKRRGQKRAEKATWADNPGGRAAHTLVALERSLYLFGGYGGQGVTYDDIYVLRNFPKLTGAERLVYQVTEDPDQEPVQGWRSTKRPRQPPADNADHLTHTFCREHEKLSFSGAPPIANILQGKDLLDGVKELLATRTHSTLEDQSNALTARELEIHNKEIKSLQQMVELLRQEIRTKMVVEMELQANKRVLEHDIEVLQRQDQRAQTEIATLKAAAQASAAERDKERHDSLLTLQATQQRLEEKEQELKEAQQGRKKFELKMEELARSLEETRKGQLEIAQERNEIKANVQKLEKEVEKQLRIIQVHEQQEATLLQQAAEFTCSKERVLTELGAAKESTRALQETVERLAKQLERENSKVDSLEQEREELRRSNSILTAELSKVTTARNAAEADVELVRSELRTTRALLEHSEGEVSRLKEGGEQAREHIATLHTSLSKSEEDLKLQREDNNRWRSMVRDIEEFEQAQARLIQGHVEKLRCARQFCPC
ncbi:unnamed protein product [Sphagnum troendelagicum]